MIALYDIYMARKRIQPFIRRTPFDNSQFLSEHYGGEIWLKHENLQFTGSFKIRGAANRMLSMRPEEHKKGVITASAGNHGLGISYMANVLGIKARIFVPENTPEVKRTAIRSFGAELVVYGTEYIEAEKLAIETANQEETTFISAYNDPILIAGQGTVGLEMLEENPELDIILMPLGGGGLASGIASLWKNVTTTQIIGVQSTASPVMYESMKAGYIVDIPLKDSIAEGLHGGIEHGSITLDICRRLLDNVILVEEQTIRDAIRLLLFKQREVVEGAGAVGVAALIEKPNLFRGKKVCIVLSGGNLGEEIL